MIKKSIQDELESKVSLSEKNGCDFVSWLTFKGNWYTRSSAPDHYDLLISPMYKSQLPSLEKIPNFDLIGTWGRMRVINTHTNALRMKCVGNEMNIGIHEEQDRPNKAQIESLKNEFCLPKYKILRMDVMSRRNYNNIADSFEIEKGDIPCDKMIDRMIGKFKHAIIQDYNI